MTHLQRVIPIHRDDLAQKSLDMGFEERRCSNCSRKMGKEFVQLLFDTDDELDKIFCSRKECKIHSPTDRAVFAILGYAHGDLVVVKAKPVDYSNPENFAGEEVELDSYLDPFGNLVKNNVDESSEGGTG